ncbi:DEAD/DEAH box helicase family protein, partial [Clostridium paraputrificum]|nr:DEAD/DEAH box helicase family protein [Clostridium paraputrificum]
SLEPNFAQIQALDSVEFYRQQGKSKGIVILPTGVGKTYFSAFDAKSFNSKTLFIVHRDTILKQAYDSFEDVWPEASRGFFDASNKDSSSDIIFASKDTLYRDNNLQLFDPNEFGYIIIDEAHHSAATTYKKIIEYFNPKFMLGMTATPDRQDKASILELFDYNVFYEMNQRDAIESGYLTGFKYYGLKDDIDYSKIKHNGRHYDIVDLGRKLNIEKRNNAILDNKRINHYMNTGEILPEPTLNEKISTAIKHLKLAVEEHGEYVAVREMRKHIAWYLKGLRNSAKLRDEINKIEDYQEVVSKLEYYMEDSLT